VEGDIGSLSCSRHVFIAEERRVNGRSAVITRYDGVTAQDVGRCAPRLKKPGGEEQGTCGHRSLAGDEGLTWHRQLGERLSRHRVEEAVGANPCQHVVHLLAGQRRDGVDTKDQGFFVSRAFYPAARGARRRATATSARSICRISQSRAGLTMQA